MFGSNGGLGILPDELLGNGMPDVDDISEEDLPHSYVYNMSRVVPVDATLDDNIEEIRTWTEAVRVAEVRIVGPGSQQGTGLQMGLLGDTSTDILDDRWLPRDAPDDSKYLPVDEHEIRAPLNERVGPDEDLTVRFVNNDPRNERFVKVLVTVIEPDPVPIDVDRDTIV